MFGYLIQQLLDTLILLVSHMQKPCIFFIEHHLSLTRLA